MATNLSTDILAQSVIAVPPLARRPDFSVDLEENRRMIQYLEAGGISTLLYGGNANFYHVGLTEYESILGMLTEESAAETIVIPSVGPSWGMINAQIPVLKSFDFPSVMLLPSPSAVTSQGTATGVRKAAEMYGKPIVLYVKYQTGITPEDCARLVQDGVIAAIKYAIVLDDPHNDPYLSQLLEHVSPDIVVSGMGEQPAIVHMKTFGLNGFTSGCVCIAPAQSQAMLQAIQAGDYAKAETLRRLFAPLEALRNALSPVRVLHEAVRLCAIADTGVLSPMMSNLEERHHAAVKDCALELMAVEQAATNP